MLENTTDFNGYKYFKDLYASYYNSSRNTEERNKMIELAQSGDAEAFEQCVLENLRMCFDPARKYSFLDCEEDILQDATIGLMLAVMKFDVSKGYEFSTYAWATMKASILRSFYNNSSLIRKPVHVMEKISRLKTLLHTHESYSDEELFRLAINKEIIKDHQEFDFLCSWIAQDEILSLSSPINEEKDLFLSDSLVDPSIGPEDFTTNQIMLDAIFNSVRISEKEKDVISRRVAGQTLEEIGLSYNVCRERIRQIEKKAYEKIARKAAIEHYEYEDYTLE